MSKSRLFALLTRDHAQLAERYAREGDKAKAADLYAKAGEYLEAARLAAEIPDERRAITYSMKGTLGSTPEGYESASAEQAGELLARSGFHQEAIDLFELGHAYRRAAESALKLQQTARAARFYERAKAFAEAAIFYRRGGMLEDALRVLELEANRLKQDQRRGAANPAIAESLRKVDLERAEILAKLGKQGAGADLLHDAQPTPRAARLLEEAGRLNEAIEAYLKLGENEQALRLVGKSPDLDRRLAAQVYQRCGRPLEAGHLFATLGQSREAAQAYEAGGDWARAGSRWETAQDLERAAQAYLRADRPRDAARCFAAAGTTAGTQLAAATYVKAGDRAAAAAQYLKAGQPLLAANQLLAAGDRTEAARVLTQVQPRDPAFREAMLLLVPLLVEERLFEEALRRLRLVPEETLAPGAATPSALDRLYWEARAVEGLGRTGEALACYQKLVTVKRDHRDAAERLAGIVARAQAQPTAPTRMETALPGAALAESSTLAAMPRPAGPMAGLAVGARLAERYDILSELGRGGMGRVYKARDRELDELVAIKTVLHRSEGADEERLLREIQICRRITHPNVVRVFDLGRFPGGIFITMELIEGERLDRLAEGGKPVPLGRVKTILGEIAAGLEEAHALGIVHRDLKPGNVILTPQRVKILDFGIASMAGFDTRLTQTGFAVGSPMYMSPEQLQGVTIDGRADLYSLGVLAYTLIAGREPFTGSTATALALQHLQAPPPDIRRFRPDLPEPWVPFLGRLLAKRPGERFQSAREVREAAAGLPA